MMVHLGKISEDYCRTCGKDWEACRFSGCNLGSFEADAWRSDQIAIAQRNQANGIPDSRWCGNASCDLNGVEHGHGRSRHPMFKPAPIDLSWVTTEPEFKGPVWPVWLGIAVVGGIPLAFVAAVMVIAWLVTS